MTGAHGIVLPPASLTGWTWVGPFMAGLGIEIGHTAYFDGWRQTRKILLSLLIVWLLPTTQQLMARFGAALETYPGEVPEWRRRRMHWHPNLRCALLASALAVASLLHLVQASEFLYCQF